MKKILTLFIAALVLASVLGDAQSVNRTTDKENSQPRIDSAITKMAEQASNPGASVAQARALGVPFDGNNVTLTLVLNTQASRGRGAGSTARTNAIAQAFGTTSVIASQSNMMIRLRVPVTMLPLLEFLLTIMPDIAYIRPPLAPQALAVSEGVSLTGATAIQNNGNTGQGTKIAIIDLGFAGLSTARARGELPGNVITRDFSGTGLEFTTNHGTAVAEIAHDMAPGAQLYLWKVGDEVDLENAVNEAIAQGINIINHSVGWFNTSYYDGTGVISTIAQNAINAGILWVNSAGNYGKRHYKGVLRDNNGNGWHEFSGSDESIDIQASAGETIQLFMTWREWPFTAQDYDLVLYNQNGQQVAISDKTQNGSQEPTESLRYFVPTSGAYRVQIQRYSGNSPKEITLFSLFQDIEHAVAQSSIVSPADVTGVLSVAAIDHTNWSTGPVADYSSQGPTNDGRPKPDITGPDNVTNSTFGNFPGTSAAAPHVAGAAALLLSQNPNLSGSQLASQLRNSANAIGSPLATGSGRLALTPPAPTTRADLTIGNTDFTPRNPNIGELIRHTITVQNQGNAAASSFTVRFEDQSGTQEQFVPSLAAGASTSLTFSRTLNVANDSILVTADSNNQITESNENNNTAQYSVTGQNPPPTGSPDLIVETLTFNPQNPLVGQLVNFTMVIRNQGNAAAGPFRIEFTNDGGTAIQSINGLAAGGSVTLNPTAILARNGESFLAEVDTLNQVTESNENNNTRSVTVQGNVPTPTPSPTPPPINNPRGTIQTNKSQYFLGEALTINFSTDTTAYAYIYNVDASGRVGVAFPNGFSSNNFVGAGSYVLPDGNYQFTVTGPVGTESLHLLLSTQPVNLGLDGLQNSSYANANTFANVLQNQAQSRLGSNGWDTTFTTYQVGPTSTPTPTPQPTNRQPQADFTINPTAATVNQVVTFDASSSFDPDGTIVEYRWDFNSNGVINDTGVRVTTTFGRANTKNVTLTVIDNQGASASVTKTIEVTSGQSPVARFTVSPTTPTVNQVVTFDASSSFDPDGTIVEYRWDFNSNGVINDTGVRVTTTFGRANIKQVKLTVIDNQGRSASTTQNVEVVQARVNQSPTARINFSPTQPLTGEVVLFDASASSDPDGTITGYRWDLNSDGVIESTSSQVTARFNTATTYMATLTVFDNEGASHTTQVNVAVRSSAPVNQAPTARFTFSPNNPVMGQQITFDASTSNDPDGSIIEYMWDFDGDGFIDDIGMQVTTQFSTAATFRVTLTVMDDEGEEHSISQNLPVSSPQSAPQPSSDDPIKNGWKGIYIMGEGNKLHIVVNGSPSWSTPRSFRIELGTNTGFTNPQQESTGDATGSINMPSNSNVTITGRVGTGRIDFYLNANGMSVLEVESSMNGAGRPFIVIEGKRYRASSNPFSMVATDGWSYQPLFPFAKKTLYTCPAPYRHDRFSSCTRVE